MALPLLPNLRLTIYGKNNQQRSLIPQRETIGPTDGANKASFGGAKWETVMPGGFGPASFTLPDSERTNFPNVYVERAQATLRIYDGPHAGQVVWKGEVKTPTANGDGTCTLEGIGYWQLLHENHTPMFWMVRGVTDWGDDGSQPFDSNFNADVDGITAHVEKGRIRWEIPKGTQLKGGGPLDAGVDKERVLMWAPGHVLRRIAGTFHQKRAMPGSGRGVPNYNMRLEHYSSLSEPQTDKTVPVQNLQSSILAKGAHAFDVVVGKPKPLLAFLMWRMNDTDHNGTDVPFNVWISNLRVNGDAYRGTPADWDSYLATDMVKDIADVVNIRAVDSGSGGKLATQFQDGSALFSVLPMWWHSGSIMDLMDHLASLYQFKWAIWETPTGGNEFEFGHWNTSWTQTWTVYGYGANAMAACNVKPSEDVYSHVRVSFRLVHGRRKYHVTVPVVPDPYAGLPGPPRTRTRVIHLHQRQHNDSLATTIAKRLAKELANPRLSGSIGPVSAVYTTSGTIRAVTALLVRAGDLVQIADYPGGAKTLRIHHVSYDDGGVTMNASRAPFNLAHLILQWHRHHMRHHDHGQP